MNELWDKDIADLALTESEKDGLQVYRNYSRAFEDHAEKQFSKQIDAEAFDTTNLERALGLMATEDPRFVPVIACAFADDQLREMFMTAIPDSFFGDRSSLFGPYGPFGDLFKRIQLAHVFGMLSADLAADLDRLRKARNQLAHTWDISGLSDFFMHGKISELFPVDTLLHERPDQIPNLPRAIEPAQSFRIRVIWMVARLSYEAPLFARSKAIKLIPENTLYGANQPKRLSRISQLAMDACRKVFGV